MIGMMLDEERLAGVIAQRISGLVRRRGFQVEVHGTVVAVRALGGRHRGSTLSLSSGLMLRLPLPTRFRVRAVFENHARDLQEFVGTVTGAPWPALGAAPHARVDATTVYVWYGEGNRAAAVLAWEPILRSEVGL